MKPHCYFSGATVAVSALSILIERTFARSGITHLPAERQCDSTGRKTTLALMLAERCSSTRRHSSAAASGRML